MISKRKFRYLVGLEGADVNEKKEDLIFFEGDAESAAPVPVTPVNRTSPRRPPAQEPVAEVKVEKKVEKKISATERKPAVKREAGSRVCLVLCLCHDDC